MAVADAILTGSPYIEKFKEYFLIYPERGYGPGFRKWASSGSDKPYLSTGNGSAMRVSPVGFALDTLEKVLAEAKKSAEVTHDDPNSQQIVKRGKRQAW